MRNNEEGYLSLHFFCGEPPFFGGSAAFEGLGLDILGATAFGALLGATNLFGFAGSMFLVTRLNQEEEIDDGKCTTCSPARIQHILCNYTLA